MASLEKSFVDIFYLVRRPNSHDIKGNNQVCQEASDAFQYVENEINISHRHKIKVIGEMIRQAWAGDSRSALEKISSAEAAYNKYVLEHLKEMERAKGKEARPVSVHTEPVASANSSNAENMNRHTPLTRNDVIGQFKQMYDVEWKSAYDEMIKAGVREEKSCEDLYYITKTIYHQSQDVVRETVSSMDKACRDIVQRQQTSTEKTEGTMTDEANGLLLLFIRQNYELVHDRLQQKARAFLENYKRYPKTVQFAERCATVTWWMQVQDPPMSITYVEKGETCKPETYEFSGQTGNLILYRIMPALLTDSNGEVLVKGRMA